MYKNYCKCKKCCALNNYNDNYADNIFEQSCNDVCNHNYVDVDDCMCGFDEEESVFPTNPMLAQSYVPWQTMNKTFVPCVGLKMGTIFPELVSPYMPGDSMKQIEYIASTNDIKEGCNDARR